MFTSPFNLSSLNGSNGFIINGIDPGDLSGISVSSAGDINGDGIADLIIGAYRADPNGNSAAGESYVVFGGSSVGSGGVLNLSALNGSNGFVLNGIDAFDLSGISVSSAGDINGDGIDDLIIGAFLADPNGNINAGESYVVFGGSSVGSGGVLNLSALNGSNGFVLNGIDANDRSGRSVSGAGDINGDGIADIIIGAVFADPNGNSAAGESYVVFGGSSVGSGGVLNLSALNGSNGFVLNGIDAGDRSGRSVSSAGDINGDGFADLIIGAYLAAPNGNGYAGESYVVFGGSSVGSGGVLNLSALNGSNGLVLNGINADDRSGRSVSGAGDINGDGIADLIIGAFGADPNGNNAAGESYVVFGVATNTPPVATDDTAATDEDTPVVINVLANDTDAQGGLLLDSFDAVSANGGTISRNTNGTPTLADDTLTYTPAANFNGTDSFSYTISDGQFSDTATVTVTVAAVNDAPVNSVPGAQTVNSSAPLVFSTANGNAISLSDVDAGSNPVQVTLTATNGSLTLGSLTGASLSLTDTLSNLNSQLNGLSFTSTTGFCGAASLTVTTNDLGNSGSGGAQSDSDTIAIAVTGANLVGNSGNNSLTGTNCADTINGGLGNDTITGRQGNDLLTGGGNRDRFVYNLGDGTDTITDFGGVGRGNNPSSAIRAEIDTLQFVGSGFTARNLLLTQNGANLELSFEGIAGAPQVILANFQLENLDNLSTSPRIGNILFNGDTAIQDSFDVFNADETRSSVIRSNTVTFLNDLNNSVSGSSSADVINGQGGNDNLRGLSGSDLLRGGTGDDTLNGGSGNDTLVGGSGADQFLFDSNKNFAASDFGIDSLRDFSSAAGDQIVLDKTSFKALTSAAGGVLDASEFAVINSANNSDANGLAARIVYNQQTGALIYNQNSTASGLGNGAQFATLTTLPTLANTDILVRA
jgi:hypothetical protein